MLIQNANGVDGGENMGGLSRFIYAVLASQVLSMPSLNAAKTAFVGDITLRPGAKMIKIDNVTGEDGTGMVDWVDQGATEGGSFLAKVTFKVSGFGAGVLQLLNAGLNGKFIFIAQDRQGVFRIVGSPQIPATRVPGALKGMTGNTSAEFRGAEFSFQCSTAIAPPVYSGATEDLTVPTPTASDATTITASGFTARWNELYDVDGVTTIENFKLYVSTQPDFSTFVATYEGKAITGNTEAITGLTANTNYYYKVAAVMGGVEGSSSNVIRVRTLVS